MTELCVLIRWSYVSCQAGVANCSSLILALQICRIVVSCVAWVDQRSEDLDRIPLCLSLCVFFVTTLSLKVTSFYPFFFSPEFQHLLMKCRSSFADSWEFWAVFCDSSYRFLWIFSPLIFLTHSIWTKEAHFTVNLFFFFFFKPVMFLVQKMCEDDNRKELFFNLDFYTSVTWWSFYSITPGWKCEVSLWLFAAGSEVSAATALWNKGGEDFSVALTHLSVSAFAGFQLQILPTWPRHLQVISCSAQLLYAVWFCSLSFWLDPLSSPELIVP